MAIQPFLAMTAAEIHQIGHFPEKTAWMACHFSPYGRGLSNLPHQLPQGSVLMVDDITPIHGHDPELIAAQLNLCVGNFSLSAILLDFQRPDHPETEALVRYLSEGLPCPVVVSDVYAASTDSPVFLPPVPPSVALQDHLQPWQGRDIWLEISYWGEILELREEGCSVIPLPPGNLPTEGFCDKNLFCHYQIKEKKSSVQFTLWRTTEDQAALLKEAEALGITHAAGLYQELQRYPL